MVLLVVVMPREYDMYNNRRMFFYIKAPNLNCDSGMKKKWLLGSSPMWMSAEGTSSTFFRNTRRFAPNKNLRLHKRYFIFTFLQFLPMNALFCVDLDHQGIDLFLFIRCNKLFCANLSLVKSEQRVKKKEGCAILLLMYYKSWKKNHILFFLFASDSSNSWW